MKETQLIIALDFPAAEEALLFLDKFKEPVFTKVGMELFYGSGPDIIRKIKDKGHQVFLDLKLHDIPNTVKSAMKNLASLNVDMVNVHAAGGQDMMRAAIEGLEEGNLGGKRPLCIAVTQLTSTSQMMMEKELLINNPLKDTVLHYAKMAAEAGLDGVVSSVLEAAEIHRVCGREFLTITPGIRPAGAQKDDQVRTATPALAKREGCDFIVVGRPIIKADNPLEAYQSIISELL